MRKPILSALFLTLTLAPVLRAADVTYEEETKMGGLMNVLAMGKSTKSATRVSGDFLRTDTGSNATIIDLDAEKIITLDNKKKTYSVMTFEEMQKKMQDTVAMVQGKKSEGSGSGKASSDVSTSADVKVTETGRSEKIEGLDCKQYLLEMNLTVTNEKEKQSGTMSTVTEMWLAKNFPGAGEITAFYRKMAQKMGTTSIAQQWMSGNQGQSQQFGANMQKMADEMRKMDGHAMRSVMYFGDPEAAKREAAGEKPAEGGGGFGGLGGMLKKMKPMGGDQPAEGEGGEGQGQSPGGVIMRITTETTKIDTKSIDPKVFAVPEGYKLVQAEDR